MPTLMEYKNLPGVKDLPFKAAAHFAIALKKEDEGDYAGAIESVNKAIEEELAHCVAKK